MKNLFLFLTTVCVLTFGATQLNAQSMNEKNNYLVLSKNIQQLKPILLTANELAKEDGQKYGEFYIVICGKTVTDLINHSGLEEILKKAEAQNVNIFACGLSLKKFNVNPNQLPENITVVDNGILYSFQLKKKGFITLSI